MNEQEIGDNRQAWFIQGLLPKITSLNTALCDFRNDNKAGPAAELRRQAQFLSETATHYGSASLEQAALQVVDSSHEELASSAGALLEAMSEARARVAREVVSVLVVGGTAEFAAVLDNQLPRELGSMVHVGTAEEADRILLETRVAAIVLHMALPDGDGGALFTRLRSSVATETIPILLVGEGMRLKELPVLSEDDDYQKGKPDMDGAVAWVASRLRRAHERARTVWRDRRTGLMNRTAFIACGEDTMRASVASQEPLALVVVRLDRSVNRAAADRVGAILSENLRSTDLLSRWDTCTFAILFPGEDQFGARRAIEKLQQIVSKEGVGTQGDPKTPMTLTAGIRAILADQSLAEEAARAESSLAEAKAEGIALNVSTQKCRVWRRDKVLLVSADQILGKVLVSLLEQEQFKVTVVGTTREAIENCHNHRRFQLIIIDESVPPGGHVALKSLKDLQRNLRVPTVIVLDKHSTSRPEDFIALGALVCVERPLDATTYAAQMRELVWANTPFYDPSCGACRVLVVDDDRSQLYLAASVLTGCGGFRVFLAKGEEDAARRLREEVFDALIVPAVMLKYDGEDTFTLRGTTVAKDDISIILTTDSGTPLNAGLEQGTVGVLKKPIEWVSLGPTIDTMLGLSPTRSRHRGSSDDIRDEVQRIAVLIASQVKE